MRIGKQEIIKTIPYAIVGVIYVFLSLAIGKIARDGNLSWSAIYILKSIGLSMVIGIAIGIVVYFLLKLINDRLLGKRVNRKNSLFFILTFLLLFIAYIPFLLAYYPGILSYDSYSQIRQLFEHDYYEHHPLFHTVLIGLFIYIGKEVFGNVNSGAALYSIFQVILFTLSVAYSVAVLYKRSNVIVASVVAAIFALFPFNGYMAVTMTKDVLFSSSFLLMFVCISEYLKNDLDKKEAVINGVILSLSVFGVCAFRNNGKYALLFVIGVSVIYFLIIIIGKTKKGFAPKSIRITLIVFAATVFSFIFLIALSKTLSAEQGDRREMLSVPIQQLARTYVYHAGTGLVQGGDNTMDSESRAYIEEFFANDGALLYDPSISDPVKRQTITSVLRYQPIKFIKVYTRLLADYPSEYINAFLALDAGYLDIKDETHAHINEVDGMSGKGYVQTAWSEEYLNSVGFYKDSKIPGLYNLLDTFANGNAYLNIPIAKYLFMPGIWLWFFVVILLASFTYKRIENIVPLSLIAGYYITLFLGPCVQLRYLYPVMIVAPFSILLFLKGDDINEQKD